MNMINQIVNKVRKAVKNGESSVSLTKEEANIGGDKIHKKLKSLGYNNQVLASCYATIVLLIKE